MLSKTLISGFLASVLALTFFLSNAQAAPQALALLSTHGGVQLACSGDQCAATFSSYCLQNERPSPPGGTAYRLAGSDGIQVTALDRNGREKTLTTLDKFKLTAARTQVAVRISIAKSELVKLGLRRVSINIGKDVTILPVHQAGDKNPFTEAEIALVKGALRQAGSQLVDLGNGRTETVRWLSSQVNALPYGDVGAPMAHRDLVQRTTANLAAASMSAGARSLAKSTLRGCGSDLELQIYPSLRRCLESSHDAILWDLNADYWQAIHTGS